MAAQAKLEDSNISNYGSKDHKDLKRAAAAGEKAWEGCGKAPGIEIWRIEKFKVVKQEKKNAGTFYSGDAYIVLHTHKHPESDKLLYNVHFWLGAESTQDEQGTAAYKTVELDDLLGDLPVQFREVQGYESDEFLQLFGGKISLLKGGIDSGFNHVKPESYSPRLLHMKGKKYVRVTEVDLSAKSLNDGDVFLLDAGLNLYQWNGRTAGIFEKRKANEEITALKAARHGKPKSVVIDGLEANEEFWKILGGKPASVAPATSDDVKVEAKSKVLFELSDKSGELKMTKISEGSAPRARLDSKEVFILDLGHTVFTWIGKDASPAERSKGITYATDYLKKAGRPLHTPVIRVIQGHESPAFIQELS
jgi:gelsolin